MARPCVPQRAALGVCVLTAGAVAMLSGCGEPLRARKPAVLLTRADAASDVRAALESPQPDERRRAVNRLAESRFLDEPAVLDALSLIARTDASRMVRLAAVLALRRAPAGVAGRTCLDVLSAGAEANPSAGAKDAAAEAELRCTAVDSLHDRAAANDLPPDLADEVARVGVRLLGTDPSRNVRVAAARLLGYFPRRGAVEALIGALDEQDFGVCYEAERALMRLTGRTFDHDASAWRAFMAEENEPFAERGKLDVQLDRPRRTWYGWWKH